MNYQPSNTNKYQNFKIWFKENGGVSQKIQFPVEYEEIKYIGIGATQLILSNEVFLAIPKSLILSPSKALQSPLRAILITFDQIFGPSNQSSQFNTILIFLIYHKMLGQKSFYFPYLNAIGSAQNMISWTSQAIQQLDDPYITLQFVQQLKKQIPFLFSSFRSISQSHPDIFSSPITEECFMESYLLVTTRCFGWGLPETMMVPFADFLNHDCNGVYNYALSMKLQRGQCAEFESEYIKKDEQLDISILGFEPKEIKDRILTSKAKQRKRSEELFKQLQVEQQVSSNSQDNDTDQSDEQNLSTEEEYLKKLRVLAKNQVQKKNQYQKPAVNRQFEEGVTFNWWGKLDQTQSYFIVAAHRNIQPGEQVYNSYGRRSNKFLLCWYGFTLNNNKYDSVSFRLWNEEVRQKTGKIVFARYLTQKDWTQQIKIGNDRYSYSCLTQQFRLKSNSFCYQLMAVLRYRAIKSNQLLESKFLHSNPDLFRVIDFELQKFMLQQYRLVLIHLKINYQCEKKRQKIAHKGWNHFAQILVQSNRKIIDLHSEGVKALKKVINRLQAGNKLESIYESELTEDEQNKEGQERERIKKQNRRFMHGYFKLLHNYLNPK